MGFNSVFKGLIYQNIPWKNKQKKSRKLVNNVVRFKHREYKTGAHCVLRYRHLDAGHSYEQEMDDKSLELIYFVNNKK